MTRADRLLAVGILALALAIGPVVSGALAFVPASTVMIKGPSGTTEVPLGTDASLRVTGLGGDVRVVLKSGQVRVEESSCPDHVCVRSGAISSAGQALTCIPNGVTVRIGGERDDGLDAVAR